MAIALDTSADLGLNVGTSWTVAYTTTGLNRGVFIVILDVEGAHITGVTYGGVVMTKIPSSPISVVGSQNTYVYYLANPASGSNNFVISASAADTLLAGAISYTGVHQTTMKDVDGSVVTSSVSSISKTLTTTVDGDWTMCIAWSSDGAANLTAGTGTTERRDINANNFTIFDSNAMVSPAGSTTLNVNSSISSTLGMVMVGFEPSEAPTTTSTSSSTSTTTTSSSTSSSTSTTTTSTSSSSSTTTTSTSTTSTSTSTSSSTSTSTTSTSTSTTQTGTTTSSSTSTSTTSTSTSTSSSTTTTSTSTSSSTTTTSTSSTTTVAFLKFTVESYDVLQLDVGLVK